MTGQDRQVANPLIAGVLCRCPRCGEGALFDGFLQVADRCESCEFDFAKADSGDGPAVFVMMVVGFLVVIPAMLVQIAYDPPVWIQLIIWLPLGLILTLALLRPFKATLIALQFAHDAHEAQLDD